MASCKGLGGEGSAAAPHVLEVDDSSVDRAVITSILRSSQFRGESSAALAEINASCCCCCCFCLLWAVTSKPWRSVCSDGRGQREEGAGAAMLGTYALYLTASRVLSVSESPIFVCVLNDMFM